MKSCLGCFGEVGCGMQSHGFLKAVGPRGQGKGTGSPGTQLSPFLSLLLECCPSASPWTDDEHTTNIGFQISCSGHPGWLVVHVAVSLRLSKQS